MGTGLETIPVTAGKEFLHILQCNEYLNETEFNKLIIYQRNFQESRKTWDVAWFLLANISQLCRGGGETY